MNADVKREIAALRRRCHVMCTEMESAADKYSGAELVEALTMISEEYMNTDVV